MCTLHFILLYNTILRWDVERHIGNYLCIISMVYNMVDSGNIVWGWKLLDKFIIVWNGTLFNVLLVEIYSHVYGLAYSTITYYERRHINLCFLKRKICDFWLYIERRREKKDWIFRRMEIVCEEMVSILLFVSYVCSYSESNNLDWIVEVVELC